MDIDDFMILTKFARLKGVSRQAIRKAKKDGRIKHYRTFGRVTLIHKSELDNFKTRSEV